jgi:hypothetical protein
VIRGPDGGQGRVSTETKGASCLTVARLSPYAAMVALRRMPDDAPEEFLGAVSRLRAAPLRPEVTVQEVPAPGSIAPFAVAFSADATSGGDEVATGRFVLLHDPASPEAWSGTYRAVTFVRAALESDVGSDPMLGQIGWTWLEESLAAADARYTAPGGTVTRVVSESYGALAGRPVMVEIEVRASWTPQNDVVQHFEGWAALLCTVGGLPPLPPGVATLPRRRN